MPRIWIECEHHTGAGEITSNHLHDDDRKRSIERIHVTINLVSDCSLGEQTGHGFLAQTWHVLNLSHTHPRTLGRGRIDKGGVSADCNRESIGYENSIFMQSLEHLSQRRTLASNLADIVHIRFAKPA